MMNYAKKQENTANEDVVEKYFIFNILNYPQAILLLPSAELRASRLGGLWIEQLPVVMVKATPI